MTTALVPGNIIVSFLFGVRVGAWWVDGRTITLDRTWNDLGQVASLAYPDDGAIGDPARTVSYTYTNGFLTTVPSYATSISYHPNTMLHQVVHANGVTVTHGKDPNDLRRPASIATTGAATNWSTGTYLYDGARSMRDPGTGETPACPVFVDGQKFTTLKGSYEELALAFQKLIDEYVATKYPRRAGA